MNAHSKLPSFQKIIPDIAYVIDQYLTIIKVWHFLFVNGGLVW